MFATNVSEIPPIAHLYLNHGLAGQTVNWIGIDTQENWIQNSNDPERCARLAQSGWDQHTNIEYKLNSHAFRCPEFDASAKIIALGCSFTFGVGLHLNQTWPWMLSQIIGRPVWNLATGSASLDTCYRVLDYYLQHLNVECVILCEPDQDRFEIWQEHLIQNHINPDRGSDSTKPWTKVWYSSPMNAALNKEKNIRSMQHICQIAKVRFINFHVHKASEIYWQGAADESRCLRHLGPLSQQKICKYAWDLYQQ